MLDIRLLSLMKCESITEFTQLYEMKKHIVNVITYRFDGDQIVSEDVSE